MRFYFFANGGNIYLTAFDYNPDALFPEENMHNNSNQMNLFKNNYILKTYNSLRDSLSYKPQIYPDPFVLEEETDTLQKEPFDTEYAVLASLKASLRVLRDNLNYAKELAAFLEDAILRLKDKNTTKTDFLVIKNEITKLSLRKNELSLPLRSFDNAQSPQIRTVSSNLDENKNILRQLYHLPENSDIVFHSFEIKGTPPLSAMMVFFDGMVDKKMIDLAVLEPLVVSFHHEKIFELNNLASDITEKHLPNHSAKIEKNYKEISRAINSGDTAIFIAGSDEAILLETKGYEPRGVEKAAIEQSLQGTQSAFTELIQVNVSMIRALMPTNDLINEKVTVGDRIPTACSIMYLKSVANEKMVAEVKRRIEKIRTDYVIDIGTLGQLMEDQLELFFPKALQTERPDRAALLLAEGRVAILMHGSPFVLIVPVNFFNFFHFVEDYSLHTPLVNLARLIRIFGIFISMLLTSMYIAISYFHQEAIPTKLALGIDAYREKVPFPIIAELVVMEIAFEMIREAGLRVPGILGPTITIVGAIIIGQAAVAANLVSPIVVVLVSLTALASFATPDYRMAATFRTIRFGFFFLAYFLGFEGISIGIYLFALTLCFTKSFGIPYLVPWGAKVTSGYVLLQIPVFEKETRPYFLKPKDIISQPRVSRQWILDDSRGDNQK
jgi:spore germination protein KA